MTAEPIPVVERLNHLAHLFDHALAHATHDSLALFEILLQATEILEQLGPAINASKGTLSEPAVLQAALRARISHDKLTQVIGYEVGRLAKELRKLSTGSEATDRYARTSILDITPVIRLDRVG